MFELGLVCIGVGCPCPPVCNNIVTPHHLFLALSNESYWWDAIFEQDGTYHFVLVWLSCAWSWIIPHPDRDGSRRFLMPWLCHSIFGCKF